MSGVIWGGGAWLEKFSGLVSQQIMNPIVAARASPSRDALAVCESACNGRSSYGVLFGFWLFVELVRLSKQNLIGVLVGFHHGSGSCVDTPAQHAEQVDD